LWRKNEHKFDIYVLEKKEGNEGSNKGFIKIRIPSVIFHDTISMFYNAADYIRGVNSFSKGGVNVIHILYLEKPKHLI
jgi:hypothetical protein